MIKAALLVARPTRRRSGRGRPSTCPSIPARATPSSPTRRRPRPPCALSNLRPARNQGSVGGYREIMMDQLFGAHARRSARRARRSARTRRSCRAAADRGLFPAPRTQGRSGAAGAGAERRRDARPRRARHRTAARRAVRLHRHRARRAPSRRAWPATSACVDGESGPRVGQPRRRIHAQLPPATKRCRRSGRSSPSTGASSRRSRLREINALADDWFPEQNRLVVVVGAGSGRRRRCPTEAQLAAVVETAAARSRSTAYVDAGAGQALMDAPPARGHASSRRPHAAGRHHRMDAVERRHGGAQADDAEGRSDPVPRDGAGRHVAGERRRLHLRRAPPTT